MIKYGIMPMLWRKDDYSSVHLRSLRVNHLGLQKGACPEERSDEGRKVQAAEGKVRGVSRDP